MKPPLDPILIHLTSNFGIHWYGVLIVSGIMLGALYASRQAKQDSENPDHVWNGLVAAVLLGVIGARLYDVFSSPSGGIVGWSYYQEHPIEILYIWKGGLGIYGAIVGGVLGVLIYAWRARLHPLQWLDYGAPGLALGEAGAVGVEARPQLVIGGEGDVEMRDIKQVAGDIVDLGVEAGLAARGAEAGLAGERHAALVFAAGTDIECVAGVGIATGREALNDFTDVGALVWRDLVFQTLLTPLIPVVAEDLTETVVASGLVGVAPRR